MTHVIEGYASYHYKDDEAAAVLALLLGENIEDDAASLRVSDAAA